MAATTEAKKTQDLSLAQTTVALLRHYLGGRRSLIVLTVLALGAGLILNWGWLVAAGIAPLLLALAPCAAMCALGLCMNKTGGKSCSSESSPGQGTGTDPSSKTSLAQAHDETAAPVSDRETRKTTL
jgi:hypothetical protein